MRYISILPIVTAIRLAIAAVIPRYSSSTMDDTINMISPTLLETITVTATVTAYDELTISAPQDNDAPAPSRREQLLSIVLPTDTPATPATPATTTQPRQTVAGFFLGSHYSTPELSMFPPVAQITPAPFLIARARDWRADRDKAISKAREAGARGRKQGQEGRKKGQSAGAAAATAARRTFDEEDHPVDWQDRPIDWQEQVASALSIASSALAYASSVSLAASATVTVTSSDGDFVVTGDGDNFYGDPSRSDSSTTTTSSTPTTTVGCTPTQTEDPEEVLTSGVDARQLSPLASSIVSAMALLAALGIQAL